MRILAVEVSGDRCVNVRRLMIRLKGKWLHKAGFSPDNYVTVENPESGMLIIKILEQPKMT